MANSYSMKLTEKRLANARTETVKSTLEQTKKSQREAISNDVRNAYTSLILARSQYSQAVQAFELEQASMDSAARKLQAGTITPNAYQAQEASYQIAETTVRTQQLALLTAMVDYQWAVDGLASAS